MSNALEAKYADRAKLVQSFAFHLFHHEDAIFSFKSHASPHDDLSCPTGLLEVATSKFKEIKQYLSDPLHNKQALKIQLFL